MHAYVNSLGILRTVAVLFQILEYTFPVGRQGSVLLGAAAADAQSAYDDAVFLQHLATAEDDDSAIIGELYAVQAFPRPAQGSQLRRDIWKAMAV